MKLSYLLLLCAAGATAQSLFIRGVTVIDGTGAAPREANVAIEGGRIAAVGLEARPPAGARVLNGAGKSLLPGLFDLHTHVPYPTVGGSKQDWGKNLKAYLRSGVTSLADFGTYAETFAPMRSLMTGGVLEGPRVHFAARFTTPGGHGAEGGRGDFFTQEVLTPREGRAAVARVLPYKPDVIKVFTDGWRYGTAPEMSSMEEPTLRAIVEEAHKAALPVLTHTVTLSKAKIAARAGVDAIMHGIQDVAVDDELIALMRKNGVAYGPTMTVYEPRAGYIQEPLLEQLLEPAAFAALANRRMLAPPDPRRIRKYEILRRNVEALHRAGIPIVTGTDAGIVGTHHGWATIREVKLLASAGLSPLEAIRSATANSAHLLRVNRVRGTIAPAMEADLLLVSGRPDRAIADLDKIETVIKGGQVVDLPRLTAAIRAEGPTPIPSVQVPERLDDFEQSSGRSSLDTLWVNQTDPGHDHTKMLFQRILRTESDHALAVQAHLSETQRPYGRMVLPLSKGAIQPVDASKFAGVEFEARGDGAYGFSLSSRTLGAGTAAPFQAGPAWRKVRVPFSSLGGESCRKDLTSLSFELARPAGTLAWLELDNIRFYK